MPQEVEQFRQEGYLKIDGRVIDDEHLTVLRLQTLSLIHI